MTGALIVTAELGNEDFVWLDGLRRAHFPPERNHLPAHLTMFHALPPSMEGEVTAELKRMAGRPAPKATIAGLMNLGGGVAFRVHSEGLDEIRKELADRFHGVLSAQDRGGWKPHVTIQNKVGSPEARKLLMSLEAGFRPRPLAINGLGLHRYVGGPWENIGRFAFRG